MSHQSDCGPDPTPIAITHNAVRASNGLSLIGIADISIATEAAV